jgi:hypothetical protein
MMGMPLTESDLRKLQPFDFQNWVVQRLCRKVSTKKSSDMGIDGYTFEGSFIKSNNQIAETLRTILKPQ